MFRNINQYENSLKKAKREKYKIFVNINNTFAAVSTNETKRERKERLLLTRAYMESYHKVTGTFIIIYFI